MAIPGVHRRPQDYTTGEVELNMQWLITGGCGFIGTSLVRRLLQEGGHRIRVLDNHAVGGRTDLARIADFREVEAAALPAPCAPLELVVGDIGDAALALKAAQGMDVIVHLAANTGVEPSVQDPRQDCVTNVLGTLNYLEAARHGGVKRFVFASSGAPLGECEPPIHEELAPHPVSPYGASKLAGEGYCSAYYRTFGVETVALRFGNVYGPGSSHKSSVIAKFIRRALRSETLEIYGDGAQTRDFIYIDDLVRAIELAATSEGVGGEVFQIATSMETTVAELVDRLLLILADLGLEGIQVRHAAPRLGDVRRNFSDTSKAKRVLGWQAEADLATGLRRTVGWFVQNSKLTP
jgi:UDP-glucose 4-epimerase